MLQLWRSSGKKLHGIRTYVAPNAAQRGPEQGRTIRPDTRNSLGICDMALTSTTEFVRHIAPVTDGIVILHTLKLLIHSGRFLAGGPRISAMGSIDRSGKIASHTPR